MEIALFVSAGIGSCSIHNFRGRFAKPQSASEHPVEVSPNRLQFGRSLSQRQRNGPDCPCANHGKVSDERDDSVSPRGGVRPCASHSVGL